LRLRVQHEGGVIEILTLVPPFELVSGKSKGDGVNAITDGSGMSYWFTEDGYYDEWTMSAEGVSEQEIREAIDRIETGREIVL